MATLSTGASDLEEIDEALEWIDRSGVPVALMHCVLNYPTINKDANLGMIRGLKKAYPDRIIGYSDHTLPGDMKSLEVATLLGADILEKHFTHDKKLPGNDHYHSMDKHDLASFVINIKCVSTLFGEQNKRALKVEETARLNARRSLVAACLINKNSTILGEYLTWKRPAHGVSPKFINDVIGRVANCQIEEDQIITWEMLS